MDQKQINNFLRILMLTTLLVINQHRPTPESHAAEPVVQSIISETINLPTATETLNPALISNLKERLPAFLPLANNLIVTIIDFSLPGTAKRLWTIDLGSGEFLFNTYVAHGRNTGTDMAENFSNIPHSFQSSLGFYLTGKPYVGKHGNSLRLNGLEKNINDKAWERAIVVHGADYVSDSFIRAHGRLGRSHGCPAIPPEITDHFIDTVKEGSLLFIYHPLYDRVKG
jgi:hypothetical protein